MRMVAVGGGGARRRYGFFLGFAFCLTLTAQSRALAQPKSQREPVRAVRPEPPPEDRLRLESDEKQLVDRTVDHALEWPQYSHSSSKQAITASPGRKYSRTEGRGMSSE